MKEQTPVKNYRLSVRDFGPIVEADVELRPLTVFVGPSNTGKSYLAVLIYVIHLVLEHESRFHPGPFFHRRMLSRRDYLSDWLFTTSHGTQINTEIHHALMKWLGDAGALQAVSESQVPYIPDVLEQLIIKKLHESSEWGDFFAEEMKRCFGVAGSDLLVRKSADSGANITIDLPSGRDFARLNLKVQNNEVTFSSKVPSSFLSIRPQQMRRLTALATKRKLFSSRDEDYYLNDLFMNFLDASVSNLIGSVMKRGSAAFYLPASRTGVMHSHQALVAALIQSATLAGLRPSPDVQILPGVLGDFLQQLINISQEESRPRRRRRSLLENDLAGLMEKEILEGDIEAVRSRAGYPTFQYKPAGWEKGLPLSRASSMVSELAPVVLYLRHLVHPGDVLIIEEPESHLHPELQTAFARQLARLARSGVRVIVTTHSEWLLDQLSNLVRLSDLPKSQRKAIHCSAEALSREEFGAWRFKRQKRPQGSVVEEMTIDPIAGGLLADYDDTAMGLQNEWADIENRIEDEKHIKKGKKR